MYLCYRFTLVSMIREIFTIDIHVVFQMIKYLIIDSQWYLKYEARIEFLRTKHGRFDIDVLCISIDHEHTLSTKIFDP